MANKDDTDLDLENLETESAETLSPDSDGAAEEWKDELPPEDDFHDMEEQIEDVLEEMPSEEDQQSHENQNKGKSGKKTLFLLLLVGVVVLGGLAYFQFSYLDGEEATGPIPLAGIVNAPPKQQAASNEKGMSSSEMRNAYQPPAGPQNGYVAVPASSAASEQNGLQEQEKPIISGILSSDAVPVREPAAVPAPLWHDPLPLPAPGKAVAEPPPPIKEVQEIATIAPLPVAPPVKEVQEIIAIAPLPAAQPALPRALDEREQARFDALTDQVQALQKTVDQVVSKNEALMAQIDNLQSQLSDSAAKPDQALQDKVTQLEAQLAALKNDNMRGINLAPASEVTTLAAVKKPVATPKAAAKPAPAKKATAPAKAAKPAPLPAVKNEGWVLRAATPEAAWVSAGMASQDFRRIRVGEELPGLGKVNQIRQIDGRWEVVTEKAILQ
ncbi:MAG: hypothetical protein FWF24_00750 [Alphaproteobacteria bacterium]|nr:hypothetical protein [Alphaproteobacteria bacterium]